MHVYDPVFVNVARVLFQYNFNTDCIKETSIGGHVLQLDVLGGRVLGAHCTIVQLYAAKKKPDFELFYDSSECALYIQLFHSSDISRQSSLQTVSVAVRRKHSHLLGRQLIQNRWLLIQSF